MQWKSSKFTGWSINSIWNTFSVFEAPPILTLTLQISEGKGGTIQRHSEGMWSFLKPPKYLYSWVKLTYRQRLGSHSHSKVLIVIKAEGISSGSAGCPRAFAFISSIKSTIALANGTGYSLSDGRCRRDVGNPSKYRSKNWKQFQNYIYTVDGDFGLGLTAKLAFLFLVQGSPFVSTSWSLWSATFHSDHGISHT